MSDRRRSVDRTLRSGAARKKYATPIRNRVIFQFSLSASPGRAAPARTQAAARSPDRALQASWPAQRHWPLLEFRSPARLPEPLRSRHAGRGHCPWRRGRPTWLRRMAWIAGSVMILSPSLTFTRRWASLSGSAVALPAVMPRGRPPGLLGRDGLLLPHVARRINPNGFNCRWMELQWHVNLIRQISVRKDDGYRRQES